MFGVHLPKVRTLVASDIFHAETWGLDTLRGVVWEEKGFEPLE